MGKTILHMFILGKKIFKTPFSRINRQIRENHFNGFFFNKDKIMNKSPKDPHEPDGFKFA
jgi:hypothetical protein